MTFNKDKFFKKLKRYNIVDIINLSTYYSTYSANANYSFGNDSELNIYPWEIDSLLLMKIYIGQAQGNIKTLTQQGFFDLLYYIRNEDRHNEFLIQKRDILDFLPILFSNQFTHQIENRVLLYRYLYFYKLCSDDLMCNEFESKFNVSISEVQEVLILIYMLAISYKNKLSDFRIIFSKLLEKEDVRVILNIFTLDFEELQSELILKHKDPVELIYKNYYLKSYCFLNIKNELFITYPHNIIINLAYGLIYRLTEGNKNLRTDFGKRVLEKYLMHLCILSKKFEDVEVEKPYFVRKNRQLTPDVVAFCGDKCLFIESKSSVIKSSFRDINNLNVEQYYVNLYATNLLKLYKHIKNYNQMAYDIFDRRFTIDNCFGVLVNFEDAQILRKNVFDELFKLIEKDNASLDDNEREWIYSHLRILDLYEFEKLTLYKVKNDLIDKIFDNNYEDKFYRYSKEELLLNSELIRGVTSILDDSKKTVFKYLSDI